MSGHDDFLNPKCSRTSLDRFGLRRAIVDALQMQLKSLQGMVLDIGCGNMPYKRLVLSPPSRARRYIGLDLKNDIYRKPDIEWDGHRIPLGDNSVDCALATEVFEHCPDCEVVMREAVRVLRPGGLLFFTVPFLWPLHDVPFDQYRYTPFALERHLRNSGFVQIELKALGGWDASLAQMIGLWVRRRPMSSRKRSVLSVIALPAVRFLARRDEPPQLFGESSMITGVSGTARKAAI